MATRQLIISNHQGLIEHERSRLCFEMGQLQESIKAKKADIEQQLTLNFETLKHQLKNLPVANANVIQVFIGYLKKIWLRLKMQFNKVTIRFRIAYVIKHWVQDYNKKNNRYQFIISNPEDAVMESCSSQLQELDRKKDVIGQINNSIYGALGEQKVVRELEKLADNCILINDFICTFHPAIYSQKRNDYIKSIQIDHVLITPAGIFLIETKNWSQNSVNNPRLYSPVQQIKRANFAMYLILNGNFPNTNLAFKKYHLGNRKIPLRNLVVMTNYKPIEAFPYVKILTLDNLLSYVNYFEPCFSNEETQMIANYLLKISMNN